MSKTNEAEGMAVTVEWRNTWSSTIPVGEKVATVKTGRTRLLSYKKKSDGEWVVFGPATELKKGRVVVTKKSVG